jgi:hypothetical protein
VSLNEWLVKLVSRECHVDACSTTSPSRIDSLAQTRDRLELCEVNVTFACEHVFEDAFDICEGERAIVLACNYVPR